MAQNNDDKPDFITQYLNENVENEAALQGERYRCRMD
jgi:hypothetical protein